MLSRREYLAQTSCGFGALALAGLAARDAHAAAPANPLAPKPGHHKARAKRVIFLFMQGGVSHVDSYDYKPVLDKENGKQMKFDDARVIANTGMRASNQRVMKPLWKFAPRGQTGKWASDLFPAVNGVIDDLCFIHSMRTEGGGARPRPRCSSTAGRRTSSGRAWAVGC